MAAPKKYGLILPKSKASGGTAPLQKAARSNIFGDESDNEHDKSAIEDMIKKASVRNLSKVQTQMMMKKALDEDANVFEYDEVYDEMKSKKEDQDMANKSVTKDKKPRYIEGLLKNAAARKKEDERRAQRKIQNEREEENEEFGDKEAFVTAGYKKKMEEMQQEEEEAKRKEQLHEMMDVAKQKDLSGFYRHLLKQQCGEEKILDDTICNTKKLADEAGSTQDGKNVDLNQSAEDGAKQGSSSKSGVTRIVPERVKTKGKDDNPDADSDFLETSSSDEDDHDGNEQVSTTKIGGKKGTAGRTYRKRKQTDDDPEDEQKPADQNDSDEDDDDESSSSSDSEEDVKELEKKQTKESVRKANDLATQPNEPQRKKKVSKDWRSMFAKRCVGDKFEAARERYLERKAIRQEISV